MIYGDTVNRTDSLGLTNHANKPNISAIVQSGNLYVYCGNNPIRFIDHNGEFWEILKLCKQKTGNFYSWFKGVDSLTNQANRRLKAANGNPIHWYFSDKISMEATIKLFERNEITGIVCIYMPME